MSRIFVNSTNRLLRCRIRLSRNLVSDLSLKKGEIIKTTPFEMVLIIREKMTRKMKGIAETRKYLRNTSKTCMSAFEMGYNDGARGRAQQPFPEAAQSDDALARSVLALTLELYKRGYELGRGRTEVGPS